MEKTYTYYREVFRGRLMPFAFVDLDLFDANAAAIMGRARGRSICVASKSVRCVALIKRILARSPQFHSVMAYSVREAVFLSRQGVSVPILVAYPVWNEIEHCGLAEELKTGKRITLTVDCADHIDHLEAFGANHGVRVPISIDVDMSTEYPGVYFGVRRSGIRTAEQVLQLWDRIGRCPHVSLDGIMGYEAQVAGLQDHSPWGRSRSLIVRFLKKRAIPAVARRRKEIVQALQRAGCTLRFVNGGGTGSVETTVEEDVVTEVTVGSGFYSPTLLDHYARFKHLPAAGFAIEITRRPAPTVFTCHGGGYVASGAASPDKWPQPYLPHGAHCIAQEGAGEVQTPVVYQGPERLGIGDPIFMRHSKAGELCERFNTLSLVSNGAVVDEVPTYRGEGQCFL